MDDDVNREPGPDPQDLERLLVSRERAADVDGTWLRVIDQFSIA